MKRVLQIVVFASCLAGFTGNSLAGEPLRYDPDRQALAVDPYFDGWGGRIEIDFNAEHSWAGIVEQNGWDSQYGSITLPGVYRVILQTFPGGGTSRTTQYGWGEPIGDLSPAPNYSSFVETLFTGEAALDQLHYFTDEWKVAADQTTIYVRPVGAAPGGDVPVQWSDLENLYFRINSGPWQKYTDVHDPQPPLAAAILINPNTINLKSKGKWVTVYITPPEGYSASDIDVATVRLSLQMAKTVNGSPEEELLYTAGPSEVLVTNTGTKLMVKFDRSAVSRLLSPGEATLEVSGTLTDHRTFRGSDAVRVQ